MKKKSIFLFLIVSFVEADYTVKVVVKFPFAPSYVDRLGNIVRDSLVRDREIKMIIYRGRDSLIQVKTTDEYGEAIFTFDIWRDGIPVDTGNIERMDILFPNTDRVIRVGDEIYFEPMRFEDVDFRETPEEIDIVLPMSVGRYEYDIGAGPFYSFCFAVMADMHIAEGKKKIDGKADFGTKGWNDSDNNPNETTWAIQNNENIVAHINQYNNYSPKGRDIKFVVCLGDITQSSEKSEYQRAKKILDKLDMPWIPVFGNHDTWPYVGGSDDDDQDDDEVTIGEYFYNGLKTQYDSLRYYFSIPNWKESSLLSSPTDVTGHGYPSHYFNFAFDYQEYHFIGTDWNTRDKAALWYPGTHRYADVDKGESYDYTWDWLHDEITDKRRMIVLAHHPLLVVYYPILGKYCFSKAEIKEISEAGLKNNKPIAVWLGGHLHGSGADQDTAYVNDDQDTVAFVYNLEDARVGLYTLFHVYDSIKAEITCYPSSPLRYEPVEFKAIPGWVGSHNAPLSSKAYNWTFYENKDYETTITTDVPKIVYTFDKPGLHKVTLNMKTKSNRIVSASVVVNVQEDIYIFNYSGFEPDDPPPYEDTPWNSLSQPVCGVRDITAQVVQEPDEDISTPYGEYMYKLKGYDESDSCGSCNMKLYDCNIPITENTFLSCKFYIKESPQHAGHISLDGICSPWARLRDYFDPLYGKVVDQYGNTIRASRRSVPEGEWVEYVFNLSPLHGKTLKNLAIAYDDRNTSEQGWFTAYSDELKITEGYPNKYEWYVEVFGGDENAEVTWKDTTIEVDGMSGSYAIQFIVDNNGGSNTGWLSLWPRIRMELDPIPVDENTIISWAQYDKAHALIIGVLLKDQAGGKHWLYYAKNAYNHWDEKGWVDMGDRSQNYNVWEYFTRNIYQDYYEEYGVYPTEALAIRIGHFAKYEWDGDHGGIVVVPYIGPKNPSGGGNLHVDQPNGGEKWMVGTVHFVEWTYSASNPLVKWFFVQYTTNFNDPEPLWKSIGVIPASSGPACYYMAWEIPDEPSEYCRVRVIATDEKMQPLDVDISDNNFTIYKWNIGPCVDDIANIHALPPGGDMEIEWYVQGVYGVSSVDVFLSGDNGAEYELMAEGLSPGEEIPVDTEIVEQDTFYYYAYHGTYTLTMPETPTSAARIKLVAHDTAGNSWDWVSEPFSITFAEGEKLSTSYTASKIVYDGSNTHVVYKKDGEIKYSSTTDGYTWQEPEVISSAKDVSIGYGNFPYILYVSSDRKTLYYSVKQQGSWSSVPLVSYFEDIIGEPSQVMYDDTMYVVFFTNKEEEIGGGITYTQASLNLLRFAVDNPSQYTISSLWQYTGASSLPLISAPSLVMDREKVLHVAFSHAGNTYIIKYENGTSSIQTIENASSPSLYVTNGNIYLLCKKEGVWIKKTGYVGDDEWIDEDTVSTSLSTAEIVDAGCIIGKEDSVTLYLFDFVSSSYEREVIGGDGYYPHGILSDDRRFIWSENIDGSYYVVTRTEDVKNAVPEYYIVSGSVYRVYGEDGTYNGKDIDTGDSVGYYIPLISSDKSYKLMLEITGIDTSGKVVLSINGTEDTVEVSDDFGVYVFELASGENSVSISIKRVDVSFGVLRLVLYEGELNTGEMLAFSYGGVQGKEILGYDFYPLINPVIGDVVFFYSLPGPSKVSISIYDVSGRLVRKIERKSRGGINRLVWNRKDEQGKRVPKGVYFIRFETENYKKTQKIVIIK